MCALVGGDISWNMALECSARPKLTRGEEGGGDAEKVVVAAVHVKVEPG